MTVFNEVKDPSFNQWEKAAEISEAELFGAASIDSTGTGQQPPATPHEGTTQRITTTIETKYTEQFNIGMLIDETFAIECVDNVVPVVIAMGLNAAGVKTTKAALQASAREKEALKPSVRAVLDTLKVKPMTPWEMLLVACCVVYGPKAGLIAVNDITSGKRAARKQEELNNSQADTNGSVTKRRHTGKPDCKCPKCANKYGS